MRAKEKPGGMAGFFHTERKRARHGGGHSPGGVELTRWPTGAVVMGADHTAKSNLLNAV